MDRTWRFVVKTLRIETLAISGQPAHLHLHDLCVNLTFEIIRRVSPPLPPPPPANHVPVGPCIGQELAKLEARATLVSTVAQYEFDKVGMGGPLRDSNGN